MQDMTVSPTPPDARLYAWGAPSQRGVRLGLRSSGKDLLAGGALQVEALVGSATAGTRVGNEFALVVMHDGERTEYGSGPRSTEPQTVTPGVTLLAAWRLTREQLEAPGGYRLWAEYRTPEGDVLRSGELQVQVA